jgi:hypothetical protein
VVYHRPTGGAEIITAVTPLSTPLGCWALVASFSEDAFPSAHLGQPYCTGRAARRPAPYSPDLNPIEQAFAKFMAALRRAAERSRGGLCRPSVEPSTVTNLKMPQLLQQGRICTVAAPENAQTTDRGSLDATASG